MASSTGFLIAQILITITCLPYTVGLYIADMNKTHATNPLWTGHARFHVVWQTFSYSAFGLVALALIWWPGALHVERVWLAALFSAIVFGTFLIGQLTKPFYEGKAHDENGIQPVDVTLGGITFKADVNSLVFTIFSVILAAGAAVLAAAA